MYCPNCGSNNQSGTKFCTRCGTNLGAVTDALSGKTSDGVTLDDFTVKLLKKYYTGRRDAVLGVGLLAGAALLMTLLAFLGMKPMGAFWVLCWMFFWGVIAIAEGVGKWLASNGEMKKLGRILPQAALPRAGQGQVEFVPNQPASAVPGKYATDPIDIPGSVTEHTTRQLDERARPDAFRAPGDRQQKQAQ
jgi:hypothetical protein